MLASLYPRYYPFFRAYAAHRGHEDPESFAQEVFCRALAGRRIDQGHAHWLGAIAANLMTDYWRKRRLVTEPLDPETHPQRSTRSAEDAFLADEEWRAFRRAMRQLTEAQYLVISARFFRGLTTEETAARLGLTVGATKALQHRATARLRTLLEAQEAA